MWIVIFSIIFVGLVFWQALKRRPISKNRSMTALVGMVLGSILLVGSALLYAWKNPQVFSYPCLVPQVSDDYAEPIRLLVWNRGNDELTGLKITVRNSRLYGGKDADFFNQPETDIGTIGPRGFSEFSTRITPDLDEHGEDTWLMTMHAQTGIFTETLKIRKGINGRWAYQYWITNHTPVLTNPSAPQPVIEKSEWSDGSH